MSTISKKYQKRNTLTLERFDQSMAAPILLGILFFFVLCLGAVDSIKGTVIVVAVFTLLIIAMRFNVLRERVYWPFIALTLVVLMDGISTFYAVSGKFALREFLKVFLAYLMAVILLATSPKKEEVKGKRIATILAVCTAVGSLISIDLISTRWISGAFSWALGHFSRAYEELNGINLSTRIDSFFLNSNVFAGFSGLGALISLGMTMTENSKWERRLYLCVLYVCFLSFILSVSIGATAFLMVAFLLFLTLSKTEERIRILVLLLFVIVLSAISAALIFKTSFNQWEAVNIIPLLCVVLGMAALCFLDGIAVSFLPSIRSISKKRTAALFGTILGLVTVYGIAAWNITGDITLAPGGRIDRALYLTPGEYSLSVSSEGNVRAVVISRNLQEIVLSTDKRIYQGAMDEANFVVPEDSRVVLIYLISPDGAHISSAFCGKTRIPLEYKLLPESIASRLQGLRANVSLIRRLIFFQDGIKLFKRSPIIGLGMGAFENGIKSVQSFYYETKYAHNHYFQTMLETGIIGLFLFLSLLISSAVAVWKSRKEQPLAPMLGAVWFFMAGQALHDVVFSAYAYLPVAYGSFIMIDLCCGQYIQKPKLTKTVRTVSLGVIAACTVVYCGFLAGNMMAKRNVERNPTMETLTKSVNLDRFEWADYALPYVINAIGDNVNVYVRQQADEYAERLAQVNSNTIPIYLAEYYFSSDRMEQGISMVEKYVDYVASDQKAWQSAFQLLQAYDDGSETFHNGVIHIAEKLDIWNAENLGTITLDETAIAYIEGYKT